MRILDAAEQAFSGAGYADVGVREIAAAAKCDTALIRRYFGSKEALFEAALRRILDVSRLISAPRQEFGARAVAHFMEWGQAEGRPIPMLIFATADPSSRAVALRVLHEQVVEPIAAWLGGDQGRERAARISMLCGGYFLYSQVLPLTEAQAGQGETEHWLAAALQRIVDEAQ